MKKIITTVASVALTSMLVSCGTSNSEQAPAGNSVVVPTSDTTSAVLPVVGSTATGVTSTVPAAPVNVLPTPETKAFSKTVGYTSPAGKEEIIVTIQTVNNVISSVTVIPTATHEISKKMQANFTANIGVAVGKPTALFQLDTVGGASLTTKAFNEYVQSL